MKLTDWLPPPPWAGPPLPRILEQRWPWLSGNECQSCTIDPDRIRAENELDEKILRLHRQGLSAVEIAARLNVTPDLVRYRLRRAGLEPIHAARFLKAERLRHEVLRLHGDGYAAKRISEELGIDLGYVYYILRRAKQEPRPAPEETRAALAKSGDIITLAQQRVPRHEIAKRTGTRWPPSLGDPGEGLGQARRSRQHRACLLGLNATAAGG